MKTARVDVVQGARLALRSLEVNRMRTALTTAGIGVGVATLLAIISILQGLQTSFDAQLASLGTHTLFVSKVPWAMKDGGWQYRHRKDLTPRQVEQLRARSTYASFISPTVSHHADLAHGGEQLSAVRLIGATPEYLPISGFEVTRGRILTEADAAATRPVALIGAGVADRLFPGLEPVGRTLRIEERPFQVVGTLSRKGRLLGDDQDLLVLLPFETLQATFGKDRPLGIALAVERAEDVNEAEEQVVGILRRARGTPPGAPEDFSINRPESLAQTYEQLTSALHGVAVGVGLITALVGGIGILNIMLVSVRERTREIGIRRALGARKRTIVLQFLMEALAVSSVGGLLGTGVGLGVAEVVALLTPLVAEVRLLTVLGGVGFAALVGLLAGLWPAARAANLEPVQALRYE